MVGIWCTAAELLYFASAREDSQGSHPPYRWRGCSLSGHKFLSHPWMSSILQPFYLLLLNLPEWTEHSPAKNLVDLPWLPPNSCSPSIFSSPVVYKNCLT